MSFQLDGFIHPKKLAKMDFVIYTCIKLKSVCTLKVSPGVFLSPYVVDVLSFPSLGAYLWKIIGRHLDLDLFNSVQYC